MLNYLCNEFFIEYFLVLNCTYFVNFQHCYIKLCNYKYKLPQCQETCVGMAMVDAHICVSCHHRNRGSDVHVPLVSGCNKTEKLAMKVGCKIPCIFIALFCKF